VVSWALEEEVVSMEQGVRERAATSRSSGWSVLVVIGISGLLGCHRCGGDDDVGQFGVLVGGPCLDDDDCVERCLEGGRYPGGTCTIRCDEDEECPDGTWCVDHDGGVCLLGCEEEEHCRNGYECEPQDRRGTPGDVLACRDED
jgi:hypothetical protein